MAEDTERVSWRDSNRPLRLRHPPTPEGASASGVSMADMIRELDGSAADFSVASLEDVDRILDSLRDAGSDAVAETVWDFGCYVGEVIIRNNDGRRWGVHELATFPVVLRSDGSGYLNPIAKAFKRVDNGLVDSIPYFYRALVNPSYA